LFSPQPCSAQNWRLPMCMLLSLINAVLSGVGKWNRIVYGSRISSHDPGLKFKNCPALNGCCAWVFSSQFELDDRRIKGRAVMKLPPLAQGHLQDMVIDPAPAGSEAWNGFSLLFEIQEMLEDVKHHRDKVKAAVIDNTQFPPWRWDLFPQTPVAPPEGYEH